MGLLLLSCGPPGPAPSPVEGRERVGALQRGVTAEGALAPDQPARFAVTLARDEAIAMTIEQISIDLEVQILDEAGQVVGGFDGPYGAAAPERVCFVAPTAGRYVVQLVPFGTNAGRFAIAGFDRHPATAADRSCADAARRFMAAERTRFAGDLSVALADKYEQIHRQWTRSGARFLAVIALRQAGIVRQRIGDSSAAEARYQRALHGARQSGDAYLEVSLLNDLGQVYRDRRDLQRAQEVFEQARVRAEAAARPGLVAMSLNNLALVDEAMGRFHRAMDRLRDAARIKGQGEEDEEYAQIRINLARMYTMLDHHEEALEILSEAVAIARERGDARRVIGGLTTIGWVHYLNERPGDGVPHLLEALELVRQRGNRRREIGVLDRLGTLQAARGRWQEALQAYEASLAISLASDHAADAAFTQVNLGCLYGQMGQGEKALALLAAARPQLEESHDPAGRSFLEFCQARAERHLGALDSALASIERARGWVDDLHGLARLRGERFRPVPLWQDFAELQLHLLMDQAEVQDNWRFQAQALEQIDLARTRSLFELVLEGRVGVRSEAEQKLLDRERSVQARLNAAAASPSGEAAPAERVSALTVELERVRTAIRAADPRYARVVAPTPLELSAIRGRLDADAVLLRYVLTAERSYLFVVGADHWQVWTLASSSDLAPQIQRFYESLRQSHVAPLQAPLSARFLTGALLPDGAIPDGTRKLMIVADGSLHYVPFAALAAPSTPNAPDRLLIDDFEVHYLPSAAMLGALRTPSPTALDSAAVFADAVFSTDDPRLGGTRDEDCGDQTRGVGIERLPDGPLPRLPCTRREAEHLLRLVGEGRTFAAFDFAASKQAVLSVPLDRYRILHFATHAFIDEQFPELSGLVLSRVDAQRNAEDGDLFLHEIYGLELAADLVTLSGCQTALGRQVRGNGLLSMARGFLYAGSARVLVSLWSVHDEATAELMAQFYEGLVRRREAPPQALRNAQRWMRSQPRWRAPYYWAPFVLQGSP